MMAINYLTAVPRARKLVAVCSSDARALRRLGLAGFNAIESSSLHQAFVAYSKHIQGGMVLARMTLGIPSPCHGIRMGAALCTFRL